MSGGYTDKACEGAIKVLEDSGLKLFAVCPKGYADKMIVVVARSSDDAAMVVSKNEQIAELVKETGCTVLVSNLTDHFAKLGYEVTVTTKGVFH